MTVNEPEKQALTFLRGCWRSAKKKDLKEFERSFKRYRRYLYKEKGHEMNIFEAYQELKQGKIIETDIGDVIFQSIESITKKTRFYKICQSNVEDEQETPFDEINFEELSDEMEEVPLDAFEYTFTSYDPDAFKEKWEDKRRKLKNR